MAHSGAARAGVDNLTRTLAPEWYAVAVGQEAAKQRLPDRAPLPASSAATRPSRPRLPVPAPAPLSPPAPARILRTLHLPTSPS